MLKRCGNAYSTSKRNYQTFNKIQTKSSFGRHVPTRCLKKALVALTSL